LCVAAAAAFHFEFTLVENKSYYSAPTTLRRDQGCNPFLVGGCSVGPSEDAVQQNKRTKSEGKDAWTTNPRRAIRCQYNVHTSRVFQVTSRMNDGVHHLARLLAADRVVSNPLFRCKICLDAALDIGAMDA
jgi:hypothetical protein